MTSRIDAWNVWMQDPMTKDFVKAVSEMKVEGLYALRHCPNFESYCFKDGRLDAITSILEFIEEMQKE